VSLSLPIPTRTPLFVPLSSMSTSLPFSVCSRCRTHQCLASLFRQPHLWHRI
jgi:hypothetical protein